MERFLPRVRGQTHRPQVYSRGERERLFTIGCPQPKHRAFLMTVYGGGLRLREACLLKPEHIDSARMLLPRRFPGAGSRRTSPPAPGTMAARELPEAHLPAWHLDFQLPAPGAMGYFPLSSMGEGPRLSSTTKYASRRAASPRRPPCPFPLRDAYFAYC